MDCSKCANKGICKFTEDSKEIEAGLQAIRQKIGEGNPVSVDMFCKCYKDNTLPTTKSINPFMLQQQGNRPGIYYRD